MSFPLLSIDYFTSSFQRPSCKFAHPLWRSRPAAGAAAPGLARGAQRIFTESPVTNGSTATIIKAMNPLGTITGACCDSMLKHLSWKCADHASLTDCPDALVGRFGKNEDYGLFIHDGGSSYVAIAYCPWCGTRLRTERGTDTLTEVHEFAGGDLVLWSVDGTVHIKTTNKYNDPVELSDQESLELSALLARIVKDGWF